MVCHYRVPRINIYLICLVILLIHSIFLPIPLHVIFLLPLMHIYIPPPLQTTHLAKHLMTLLKICI